MDGTLISTEAVIVHCVNETSKKYLKRALPAGDAFWTLGPPARNIIKGFAESLPTKPVRKQSMTISSVIEITSSTKRPSFRESRGYSRSSVHPAKVLR